MDRIQGVRFPGLRPREKLAVFGGLQIQRGLFDRTISETTLIALTSATAYALYRPETNQYHHSYDKKYERKTEEDQTFHLRIEDHITQTSNWAFGFEAKW